MQLEVVLRAIGDVLKEQRTETKDQIDALNERLDDATSSKLVRTVVHGLLLANLSSIDRFCDDIMWKKSKALNHRDDLPSIVRKTL